MVEYLCQCHQSASDALHPNLFRHNNAQHVGILVECVDNDRQMKATSVEILHLLVTKLDFKF